MWTHLLVKCITGIHSPVAWWLTQFTSYIKKKEELNYRRLDCQNPPPLHYVPMNLYLCVTVWQFARADKHRTANMPLNQQSLWTTLLRNRYKYRAVKRKSGIKETKKNAVYWKQCCFSGIKPIGWKTTWWEEPENVFFVKMFSGHLTKS